MYFNHECESNLKNIKMKNLFTALLVCLLYLPNFLDGQNLAKTEATTLSKMEPADSMVLSYHLMQPGV